MNTNYCEFCDELIDDCECGGENHPYAGEYGDTSNRWEYIYKRVAEIQQQMNSK